MAERVVVTGAASGLGRAVVEAFAAGGARVVGMDLPGAERAVAVASAGAAFVACDVTSPDDWKAAAAAVADALGSVSVLVLNAGVMTRSPRDPVVGDPLDLVASPGYRRVFAVNVDGTALGLAALRPLLESPGASVVVTASAVGLTGLGFDPFYSMSKHALVGLVRSVAPALAKAGIRLNALCPGGIDTAIVPDDLRGAAGDSLASPADVAAALVALTRRPETGATWLVAPGPDPLVRYTVAPVAGHRDPEATPRA